MRAALWANPLWDFKLSWEILADSGTVPGSAGPFDPVVFDPVVFDTTGSGATPMRTFLDFFLARQGSFDSFLFVDPTDNSVTSQIFGTGDGITTQFQLSRTFGGAFNEAVQNINGAPVIQDNGVTKTAGVDYAIGTTGIIVFSVAPLAGHVLTWTGSFYFRLRFKNDLQELENFLYKLWRLHTLELTSVKL